MKKLVVMCMCVSVISFAGITSAAEAKTPEVRKFKPKEIKMDRNYDGLVDRVEAYDEKGIIIRSETDTNGDGKINEWVHYKKGIPVKAEKDTNKDGKPDNWIVY